MKNVLLILTALLLFYSINTYSHSEQKGPTISTTNNTPGYTVAIESFNHKTIKKVLIYSRRRNKASIITIYYKTGGIRKIYRNNICTNRQFLNDPQQDKITNDCSIVSNTIYFSVVSKSWMRSTIHWTHSLLLPIVWSKLDEGIIMAKLGKKEELIDEIKKYLKG